MVDVLVLISPKMLHSLPLRSKQTCCLLQETGWKHPSCPAAPCSCSCHFWSFFTPIVTFWRCLDRKFLCLWNKRNPFQLPRPIQTRSIGPPAIPRGRLEAWGCLCWLFSTSHVGWEQDHEFFSVSLVKTDVMATAVLLHETSRNIIWVLRDL